MRLCRLWLIPVFVILCWNPYFSIPVHAVNAAERSGSQCQKQPPVKKSQINLSEELGYDQYYDKICQNSSYNALSTSFKLEFQI